jgi:hypothetical protein
MSGLTERRLAIAEARFDEYEFGWDVEEVHHWHHDAAGDAFSRTVLFCGDAPGSACIRGEFVVRFLTGRPFVDECYAMIDGCLIGRDPGAAQILRKAG